MAQPTQKPGPLVWINAFIGVGKLTIARELVKLLGGPEKALLIDNHTLIDVVTVPREHETYQLLRKNVRQSCLTQLVLCEPSDLASALGDKAKTVVFTDFQSDNKLGRDVATEYRDAAERAGRRFLPVYLECEKEENVRRATWRERSMEGKGKLVDEAKIRELLERVELFEFKDVVGLRIDVTERTPRETAADLVGAINNESMTHA